MAYLAGCAAEGSLAAITRATETIDAIARRLEAALAPGEASGSKAAVAT